MMHKALLTIGLAVVLAGARPASAQSASELLQRAIYTQETLGDIDTAIRLYKKILGEAQANRAYAAQAQYRLGLCYLSKRMNEEACEAFNNVINQFQDQKEMVARAREQCPRRLELLPEPWEDGEVLQMVLKLPAGLEVGSFIWTADAVNVNGRAAWRLQTRRYVIGGANQGLSYAVVDRKTSEPIRSFFRHTLMGDYEADYEPNGVKLKSKTSGAIRGFEFDRVFYDNEQAMHLLRRLPLAVGYKAALPLFSPGGGKKIEVSLEVAAKETLQVPAGSYECYKVDFRVAKEGPSFQTFWYSTDSKRYLVKFEGGGVAGELTEAGQRSLGEPAEYRDTKFGFSITAPAGWYFFRQDPSSLDSATTIHLLDPDAVAVTGYSFKRTDKEESRSPADLRTKAEKEITGRQKLFKDYTVLPHRWATRKVSGAPALAVIADYVDGQNPMVEYLTWIHTRSLDSLFVTRIAKGQFETFLPEVDKIIASLHLTQ